MTKPDQLTSQAITAWYEAKPQDFRDHLGASLIGHSCNRYLWLTFRWAVMPKFEGRMLRLFNTGNREEIRIAEELRGIGVELYTDEDGKQITVRDDSGGTPAGSMADGFVDFGGRFFLGRDHFFCFGPPCLGDGPHCTDGPYPAGLVDGGFRRRTDRWSHFGFRGVFRFRPSSA